MTKEPILTARGLVKRYGRVTALDNADFELYPGEILAVIGDNGAGKSTLIKALCGAVTPDEGEIRLDEPTRLKALGCIERMLEFVARNPASIAPGKTPAMNSWTMETSAETP